MIEGPFKTTGFSLGDMCRIYVEDGGFAIHCRNDKFGTQPSNMNQSMKVAFDDPKSSLTLASRKGIAGAQGKYLAGNLEKLKTATGVGDWEIEADFEQILENWKKGKGGKVDTNDLNMVGDRIYMDYLGALTASIIKLCKNDLGKEAFVEAVGEKKIVRIDVIPELKSGDKMWYTRCRFEDGKLVLEILGKGFPSNSSSAGMDIEKLL